MIHPLPPRPDPSRPDHADFVRDVLAAAANPDAQLGWIDINCIAARRLRPDSGDTSRLGHAFVLELAASGLVDVEVARMADGTQIASVVRGRRASVGVVTRPMAA